MNRLSIFFLLLFQVLSANQLFAAKANKEVSVVVNGETRQYWLYVPDNVRSGCPLTVRAVEAPTSSPDGYYSLNGIRYDSLQKGMNLLNGRKLWVR